MIAYLNYRSAKARLKQSAETIEMMGGWDECQPMLQGQHNMLQLEMEYFQDESKKQLRYIILCVIIAVPVATYYFKI